MPESRRSSTHSWERGETWEHASHALGYDGIPRLEGERVENCGHFLMLDQPRVLARAIRRMTSRAPQPTLALR